MGGGALPWGGSRQPHPHGASPALIQGFDAHLGNKGLKESRAWGRGRSFGGGVNEGAGLLQAPPIPPLKHSLPQMMNGKRRGRGSRTPRPPTPMYTNEGACRILAPPRGRGHTQPRPLAPSPFILRLRPFPLVAPHLATPPTAPSPFIPSGCTLAHWFFPHSAPPNGRPRTRPRPQPLPPHWLSPPSPPSGRVLPQPRPSALPPMTALPCCRFPI